MTPQAVYEKYLLHVLAHQFKGKGHKHEVSKAVVDMMERQGLLGEDEKKVVSTGETRAQNTVAWGRNALKERGMISNLSPRGVWELTDAGMHEGLRAEISA